MKRPFGSLLLPTTFAGVMAMMAAGCDKPVAPAPTPSATSAPTMSTAPVAGSINVEDVDVTSNVKSALLRDELVKAFEINVITLKGDVRLIGMLDNQAQIDHTIKVARAVNGVHSIHDELTLKAAAK